MWTSWCFFNTSEMFDNFFDYLDVIFRSCIRNLCPKSFSFSQPAIWNASLHHLTIPVVITYGIHSQALDPKKNENFVANTIMPKEIIIASLTLQLRRLLRAFKKIVGYRDASNRLNVMHAYQKRKIVCPTSLPITTSETTVAWVIRTLIFLFALVICLWLIVYFTGQEDIERNELQKILAALTGSKSSMKL